MKAAIYCRISADRTGEQAGVTRQLEDCRNLAQSSGWIVVEEYVDNDISATSGKQRPRYQAMLAAIEAGEVDAIVTWAPDRLYRKLADLEPLIVVMEKSGCTLRTVRAGEIDMATPTGRMLARILASVATAEGEVKSDRWKRSIRQRREQGQAPGWGPRLFGYDREHQIIPAEAEAIRWAADELIAGASLQATANGLTARGHTSTLGNPWSKNGLKKLLGNPRLAGHSVLNGEIVGPGTWEPILPDETWQQVQGALQVNRGAAVTRPRVGILVGIAYCAKCGAALMSGRNNAARKGEAERPRVYRCKKGAGLPGCGGIVVQAEPLEEMVEAFAQTRLEDPRVRENVAALAAQAGENIAEVIALEDRLIELEKSLDSPGVPVQAITRAMDRTRERIETLRGSTVVPPKALPVGGDWPDDLDRRARLVRLVVAEVKVGPAPVVGRRAFQPERVEIIPR